MIVGFPGDSAVENPPTNVGDKSSIPGLERYPGAENGNPLQFSCLENYMAGYIPWNHKELYRIE